MTVYIYFTQIKITIKFSIENRCQKIHHFNKLHCQLYFELSNFTWLMGIYSPHFLALGVNISQKNMQICTGFSACIFDFNLSNRSDLRKMIYLCFWGYLRNSLLWGYWTYFEERKFWYCWTNFRKRRFWWFWIYLRKRKYWHCS